jgi:hypothetical protein
MVGAESGRARQTKARWVPLFELQKAVFGANLDAGTQKALE